MDNTILTWPLAMQLTFASAMNLLKKKKLEKAEPKIRRHDVYTNIVRQRSRFEEVFQTKEPWENAIYDYMDRLVQNGYFRVVDEIKVMTKDNIEKKYQNLTSTQEAEEAYERLWIITNLTSIKDVVSLFGEALKNDKELTPEKKESLEKRVRNIADEKRVVSFPFSLSANIADELLKEGKKAEEKRKVIKR